ncbi:DUF5677 domain-containing protein [Tenacibaculum larymnensis]|uniref:DUF5677 domain-containing protein n=1 Tax=Tenacibaculum larymnensis TaxID=2878201 RepID=A0A9X4IP32_9FLAO|nr:DUF5677 domain-containing protein [Tenacibaculum larymnensis]MDE1205886.1 DUF5677 domain-containing protein [Tenacibaculum larymnensis]
MEIEEIRYLDNIIFEEFQTYFLKTTTSNFKEEFPNTNTLIHFIDISANFIKNSIYDNCETDDYYGMKILYRCLIEHYIRFKFIFTKWIAEKDDYFSKNYLEYNDAREVLDLIRAKISEQQLSDPNYKLKDWDSFLKDHPNFKNKTRKEVEEETRKFSFKNIIRFLNNQLKNEELNNSDFFGKLIIEYSDLSSFVHGGMKSYKEMMRMNTEEKRLIEYKRVCGLAFQMSNSIKLFSLLMYVQTDKEDFSLHYLKVDETLKKINNIDQTSN